MANITSISLSDEIKEDIEKNPILKTKGFSTYIEEIYRKEFFTSEGWAEIISDLEKQLKEANRQYERAKAREDKENKRLTDLKNFMFDRGANIILNLKQRESYTVAWNLFLEKYPNTHIHKEEFVIFASKFCKKAKKEEKDNGIQPYNKTILNTEEEKRKELEMIEYKIT